DILRKTDAARVRDAFQPRRDVDAVAQQIGTIDHDIAQVNSDPEGDEAVGSDLGIALRHTALHGQRAAHGVADARKLNEDAVAGDEVLHGAGDEHLRGRGPAATRAPMWTAMPPTSSPMSSHSPVWSPALISIPSGPTPSRMAQAQRMARAGPSKAARKPSPVVLTSRPRKRVSSRRTSA